MKKGPLSNKEKAYIEKNADKKTVEELCSKLDRSERMVTNHLNSLTTLDSDAVETVDVVEPASQDVEAETKSPGVRAGDLFARNEDHGVTIMTESASMAGDESKSHDNSKLANRYNRFIHQIKKD